MTDPFIAFMLGLIAGVNIGGWAAIWAFDRNKPDLTSEGFEE